MPADTNDRIVTPEQVVRLLRRLITAHCLLSIRLEGSTGDLPSALLAVDPENEHLMLDAFSDPDQHHKVQSGSRLHVMTTIDDIVVRFECIIERIESTEEGPVYLARLPDWIEYRERRSHLRIALGYRHHSYATLHIDGAGFRTDVVNLCLNGAGLAAPGALLNAVDIGDEMPSSSIALANGPILKCTLEVRHLTPQPGRRIHVLGVRLVDLQPGPRQQLQEYLFDLQRDAMQRMRDQA